MIDTLQIMIDGGGEFEIETDCPKCTKSLYIVGPSIIKQSITCPDCGEVFSVILEPMEYLANELTN